VDQVPLKWGMGDGRRQFVQIKLKVHDDGELALDQLQWNAYTVHKSVESLGVEVDARLLGFYREEIHQNLGDEMGLELIDFKVNKIFKVEEGDSISYIVDAYITIDKPWSVGTNDNNDFIDAQLENSDDDLKHFRNDDYYMSHGAEARLRYETDNGYMEAGAFYMDHANRRFKNTEGDKYDYSKSAKGFKLTVKPDKKKCHRYSVSLRQVEFSQALNDFNSGAKRDNQIYAQYECNIDLVDAIFGLSNSDSSSQVIRH
jgi:hypothetical protein